MTMQLASFFMIAGTALWINRLSEHLHDADMTSYTLYLALFVVSVVVRYLLFYPFEQPLTCLSL